jgi:NADPH2:quinone reductase
VVVKEPPGADQEDPAPVAPEPAPAGMPAWQVTRFGEPEGVLRLGEVPVPEPGPGQVRIRVTVAGLRHADLLLVRGRNPERPDPPFVPGIEVCGTVTALGPGVKQWLMGERVCAVTEPGHGGFAREALAPAAATFLAPPLLGDAEAATFLVSYQTAWFALHRRARLRVGETLLVHSAEDGIGRATVELGRSLGARVLAVVENIDEAETARTAGADTVFDRSETDLARALRSATGGRGVDVVVDPVGGTVFGASAEAIAPEGRIIVLGSTDGKAATFAADHLLAKNYGVLGMTWDRYVRGDPEALSRAFDELDDLVVARALRPRSPDPRPHTDLPWLLSGTGSAPGDAPQAMFPPG